jgi:hypothetical protein
VLTSLRCPPWSLPWPPLPPSPPPPLLWGEVCPEEGISFVIAIFDFLRASLCSSLAFPFPPCPSHCSTSHFPRFLLVLSL